jgi:hypothetical protein
LRANKQEIHGMRFIIVLTVLNLVSCTSGQVKTTAVHQDSLKLASNFSHTDTLDTEENGLAYRQEYLSEYSRNFVIDTAFTVRETTYRIHFTHYCTWDSSLVVPAKYNFDTKVDFRTHNFQSDLIVLEGNDTAFKKTITKEDFNPLLYTALKKYATLSHPVLNIKNDSIQLFYSISIPVTDVGIGAAIQFDRRGNFTLEQ